jgi:hypothetical protein
MMEDPAEKIARLQASLTIAGQNIVTLNEQCAALKATLHSTMLLIDNLITDLRVAGGTPSPGLLIAKQRFDATMKKLLGDEPSRDNQSE